jgi:Pirin
MAHVDPFLLLDHMGPTVNDLGEAKRPPWYPHRGFETVTYVLDGEVAHRDTHARASCRLPRPDRISDGIVIWFPSNRADQRSLHRAPSQ